MPRVRAPDGNPVTERGSAARMRPLRVLREAWSGWRVPKTFLPLMRGDYSTAALATCFSARAALRIADLVLRLAHRP